ncbi:MAG: bifunctional hydroxymethylpyrimidine kinase/phosphomethylpyrimidine kinase [Acidisphaera sp.]|nr:bifunctional hydroxymethylpyrimidine kinase/phosphomethylpyrimidine kinase [Acidisphaera sp.]
MRGRVLAIAGSDSGGGAGIQADIKTITALGAYAATAITALTAQDTRMVHAVHAVPLAFLRLQIEHALADPGADAVKTGMLGDAAVVDLVCDVLEARAAGLPLVVDPAMLSKGGQALLARAALGTLKRRLLPLASVLTPNLPEAEALTGLRIVDPAGMQVAAQVLRELGAAAVLLKGGHLPGPTLVDVLATADGIETFEARRIATRHTHGTGCTLASAIAAGLAQGMRLGDAVRRARAYVRAAIAAAPGFGMGQGPLNHAVTADPARLACDTA